MNATDLPGDRRSCCSRRAPKTGPADEEYALFLRYTGLPPHRLRRVRLERETMPAIDLDEVSGVLVGGSPFNASDPFERKSVVQRRVEAEMAQLVAEVVARDAPFLGACYGVGTLGTHLGAPIDGTYAEPISVVEVTLTPEGRTDPLSAGLPDAFTALSVTRRPSASCRRRRCCWRRRPRVRCRCSASGATSTPRSSTRTRRRRIVTRIHAYAGYGYFASGDLDLTLSAVRRAPVTAPSRMLRTFVERYAR